MGQGLESVAVTIYALLFPRGDEIPLVWGLARSLEVVDYDGSGSLGLAENLFFIHEIKMLVLNYFEYGL